VECASRQSRGADFAAFQIVEIAKFGSMIKNANIEIGKVSMSGSISPWHCRLVC